MNRLQAAVKLLKQTEDKHKLNKQAACLLRLFYKVYFYNRSDRQQASHLQANIASELLLAETLSVPNELINAVVQSNCNNLTECLAGVR